MKTLALLGLALVLVTPKTWASDSITVAKDVSQVQACTVVGPVTATPPYFLPGSAVRQMKHQAEALHADTLLVTYQGFTSSGVAYRCH